MSGPNVWWRTQIDKREGNSAHTELWITDRNVAVVCSGTCSASCPLPTVKKLWGGPLCDAIAWLPMRRYNEVAQWAKEHALWHGCTPLSWKAWEKHEYHPRSAGGGSGYMILPGPILISDGFS